MADNHKIVADNNGIEERSFEYYASLCKLKQYVQCHYCEEISLEKAAAVAAMEEKYFSAFFRQKVRVPFTYWLTHVRVQKAIERMKAADHSISHIVQDVGFSSLRTFERAFKKHTGLTPRQFKMAVRP